MCGGVIVIWRRLQPDRACMQRSAVLELLSCLLACRGLLVALQSSVCLPQLPGLRPCIAAHPCTLPCQWRGASGLARCHILTAPSHVQMKLEQAPTGAA